MNKTSKKQLKLYYNWAALVAFIGVLIFLQIKFGSEARNAFGVFTGSLGMFMFGMKKMSNNLQVIAGDSLKKLISNLTRNTFMAMITGVIVTGLIQSSSATTVMVVGFVNSGLMTLIQAIGVVLGANIGTTVTAQLIAFNLSDMAWPVLAIGSAIILLGKSKRIKSLGETLVGFSLMFIGLKFMGSSVLSYKDSMAPIIEALSRNRFYGVFAGFLATLVLQSSAATVGLVMSLAATGAFGSDPSIILKTAVPIILGENMGTCGTAILASFGTTRNARRAALAHLTFNACGSFIVLPFLDYYCNLITFTATEPMRQIANAHSIFNIANVCLFLPFAKYLEKLVLCFVPVLPNEITPAKSLDKRTLKTPPIAAQLAENNLGLVIKLLGQEFESINVFLSGPDGLTAEGITDFEAKIQEMESQRSDIGKDLNHFLGYLSQKDLTERMHNDVNRHIATLKDCDILAYRLVKILALISEYTENGTFLSTESKEVLAMCFARIRDLYLDLTAKFTLSVEEAENIKMVINNEIIINTEARDVIIQRISECKQASYENIIILDVYGNFNALLSSLKYLCEHITE